MRKLLLGTTALAAATTLAANAALADVSISAYSEWFYNSRSSNQSTLDGTNFGQESEIAFKFTNKTDSGLTITLESQLDADGMATVIDDQYLAISGGFGKIKLGSDDGVGEDFGIEAEDLIAEESTPTHVSATVLTDTDIVNANADLNKVSYYLPAMGGFSAGVSHVTNVDGDADSTSFGAKFTTAAAGSTITIGGASNTTDNSTQDIDSQNIGVKITSGPVSFILAQSTYEADDEDREANGASISYNMGNGMTVGAYTMESDDALDAGEEYTKSGVEVQYTIVSGLTAVVTIDDYEYKAGTSESTTSDSGTNSKFTLVAKF